MADARVRVDFIADGSPAVRALFDALLDSMTDHQIVTDLDFPDLDVSQVRDAADRNSALRLEWWTVKTGPGTARAAWRLEKH